MCVVFSTNAEKHELSLFGLEEEWEERWVRPTDPAPVIVPDGPTFRLVWMPWGFESRNPRERAPLFNARSETVHELPTFRDAFAERRCILPVRTFYEYEDVGEKRKRSWRFSPADSKLLWIAGIWTVGQGVSNLKLSGEVCTMLTCDPGADVVNVHDRMPLMLSPDDALRWVKEPVVLDAEPRRLTRTESRPPSPSRPQTTDSGALF